MSSNHKDVVTDKLLGRLRDCTGVDVEAVLGVVLRVGFKTVLGLAESQC